MISRIDFVKTITFSIKMTKSYFQIITLRNPHVALIRQIILRIMISARIMILASTSIHVICINDLNQ